MAVDLCVWKPLPQQPLHQHHLCMSVLRFIHCSTNASYPNFIHESVSVEDVTTDLATSTSLPSFVEPRKYAERALTLLCRSGALQLVQTNHDQAVNANQRRYRIAPRARDENDG